MKKVILGLMVLAGIGLNSCTINAGNTSITKKENINKIRVFKTTKTEVSQILGEPSSVMVLSGGKERWVYQHTGGHANLGNMIKRHFFIGGIGGGGTPANTKMTVLTLTFNSRGVLIRKKFGY